ncbi:MAG: response regulator [Deltaproteobacteria bacterium]|nr:response regulator [Deltaproteobacteria bacterium]
MPDKSSQSRPTINKARVIILDESEVVRYLLESHLEAKGFGALAVESYEELETRITDSEPAMVLVDIDMPGINRDEVCHRLRKEAAAPALNVVLMSKLSESELSWMAVNSGANGFLSKQHGMDTLAPHLNKLLAALSEPSKKTQPKPSLRAPRKREATLRSFRPLDLASGYETQKDSEPDFAAGSLIEALEAAADAAVDEANDKDISSGD